MNHIINQNEYKDSPVGRIPAGWTAVELNDLGVFSRGKGISKNEVVKEGFPAIRYAEIYTWYDIVIRKFISFVNSNSAEASKKLTKNDISSGEVNLFSSSG